jgi:hypothetical protein
MPVAPPSAPIVSAPAVPASVESEIALAEPAIPASVEKFLAPAPVAVPDARVPDDEPFGVMVSALLPDEAAEAPRKNSITIGSEAKPAAGSFLKAFSAIRPESVAAAAPPSRKKPAEKTVSDLSPKLLKQELYNTYISENEYLSPVEYAPDAPGDEAIARPDRHAVEGKIRDAKKKIDLPAGPLKIGSREVLQMKLDFEPTSSAVSGESVNVLRSFAQVAADQPTNSIEIGIAGSAMNNPAKKRLAARRLAIVSNILRNSGLSDKQIFPVLSDRDEDSFSFRAIGNDRYERLSVSKGVDMFGEAESVQSYDLMRW